MFGRNWLQEIELDWKFLLESGKVYHCTPSSTRCLASVLNEYISLFEYTLGCYNGPPEDLQVTRIPNFHKARPVPYALKSKVEKALLKMEKE